RWGGYEYNQTLVDKVENADPRYNLDRRAWENRWVKPGDKALYKNIRDHGSTRVTERFIQKDNLVELRSLYLSYDVDSDLLKRAGVHSLRASITANDLWRASTIAFERGINYPFARGFTFSLQTTF
ncbi:MAG: SusC/RagA family TonB-linked outer membrane protein, partial [Odoribacteraceae bacterium]|nr:SusC/RagA family TonB-linked outer membrane protein [Odoribacteraceae bacterium]